mgnify:FL=1
MNATNNTDGEHGQEASKDRDTSTNSEQSRGDYECVVCGADNHDGDGWIIPTADTTVTDIAVTNGTPELERELESSARRICSLKCKDEFSENHD